MTLHQIEYVLAVAEYGNFSVAADSCYVSQSSLSQQIANLEKELGVLLFTRSTRSVRLTEAGKCFLDFGRSALRDVEHIRQKMADYSHLLCGTINIGAITTLEKVRFSERIADFYASYPKATVNIRRGESIDLLSMLEKQQIDVAFLTRPCGKSYPNMDFEEIGRDIYYMVVPEDHPLAGRSEAGLAEFAGDRFIVHQVSQAVSGILLQACSEAGFMPQIACRISAAPIALNLIARGIGVGLFASEEIACIHVEGIRAIPLREQVRKEIVMATLKGRPAAPLTDRFIQYFREQKEDRRG